MLNKDLKTICYTRMVIGEAISDNQLKEFVRIAEEIPFGELDGFRNCRILTENRGCMVIIETDWESRESCVLFHSSRTYRQFVAKTQHLLVGELVVKLFENRATVGISA